MLEPVITFCLTSHVGDWTIQTHSRHGSKSYDQPHVHISKRGFKGKYSWNVDGSRHDKHKFPKSESAIQRARELAGKALKIDPSICELITQVGGGTSIYIRYRAIDNEFERVIFSTYIHKDRMATFLGTPECIIIVIEMA